MACKGTHCGSHCTKHTSAYCETKYRAPRTGNPYSEYNFPDLVKIPDNVTINDSNKVIYSPTAEYTNKLKAALNKEIEDRNSKRGYGITPVSFTDVTTNKNTFVAKSSTEILVELKARINDIVNSSMYKTALSKPTGKTTKGDYPTSGGDGLSSTTVLNDTYTAGSMFTSAHWNNIRNKILSLMRECLCNGDCGVNSFCGCHNDCGCNYSDERLKEVRAEESVSSLEDFNKIKSKKWVYNLDKEHEHFGPIAQDVEAVYPEAIREDEMGYKMLDQTSMIGLLWGALNKSIDKINDLEARIEELEKK